MIRPRRSLLFMRYPVIRDCLPTSPPATNRHVTAIGDAHELPCSDPSAVVAVVRGRGPGDVRRSASGQRRQPTAGSGRHSALVLA